MTQDEIIEIARFAGGCDITSNGWASWVGTQSTEFLERFANLVAAKEREALAQPEQETVGYWKEHAQGLQRDYDLLLADFQAQRTWVGLSEDELERLIHNFGNDPHTLLDEVDARLRSRNT